MGHNTVYVCQAVEAELFIHGPLYRYPEPGQPAFTPLYAMRVMASAFYVSAKPTIPVVRTPLTRRCVDDHRRPPTAPCMGDFSEIRPVISFASQAFRFPTSISPLRIVFGALSSETIWHECFPLKCINLITKHCALLQGIKKVGSNRSNIPVIYTVVLYYLYN